ncbi:MAG: hypothetical protein ABIZ91_06975 [Gemmatimonadaceae bacterium]
MDEDILIPAMFFLTVVVLAIGVPLVRAYIRRKDLQLTRAPGEVVRDERLDRIENALEAVAVEVERISEGQRFVTRLLSERSREPLAVPAGDPGTAAERRLARDQP